ncbi:zinc finger protein with KRAB and SCAN domains 7 isoform X1 [Culex quinquefasciatus]|uniref:zinc finger protein with KRAB and SCAN domains 7 isoform X1 n=2 Tax=Culex quinquefasciatus TaxID=7176 RepID=UPI0018E2D9CF|nr:zinc finger protein with KRAB and SCAN domains 7 isoform X1 [Culex quinquefasciatus]
MESLNLSSCRMCLVVPNEDALTFSVFDTFKGELLNELVEMLFSIKISKNDHLLNICVECVNRINTVQKISKQFKDNDDRLRLLLLSLHEETTDEIDAVDDGQASDNDEEILEEKVIKSEADLSSSNFDEAQLAEINEDLQQQVDIINSSSNQEVSEADHFDERSDDIDDFIVSTLVRPRVRKKAQPSQTPQLPKHKCYFCKQTFDSELALTNHFTEHFAQVPLTCHKCAGIVIKSVRQASKHLALHDEEERPHKCRVCELRFFTRENSLTHERKIHRMKVKIQQNIDGYAERRKLRAYQCSQCGLLASNSDALRKHELTHAEVQPVHTCEICGKQFAARKNLTRHMLIHTGELPYKCDMCTRAYRQAGDLKDHIRGQHTKETPYACSNCDCRFRNVSMLHVHRKKFHSITSGRSSLDNDNESSE